MKDKNTLIRKETIGQQFGRLGGRATAEKYGNQHFKELAKIRWDKEKARKEEQK